MTPLAHEIHALVSGGDLDSAAWLLPQDHPYLVEHEILTLLTRDGLIKLTPGPAQTPFTVGTKCLPANPALSVYGLLKVTIQAARGGGTHWCQQRAVLRSVSTCDSVIHTWHPDRRARPDEPGRVADPLRRSPHIRNRPRLEPAPVPALCAGRP